jgi:hypothetical protein
VGRKHKHEEHQNLEAWVISYADMVTLLFALFVVLYAIGETKLSKLKELKQSLQWAFNFEGSGRTKEPGDQDKGQDGRGDVLQAAQLLTAQSRGMRKFLEETLPENFREVSGKSLRIVQTDDTIAFETALSAYFAPGESSMLRSSELSDVLRTLVRSSSSFTDLVRIRIEAPNVVVGREPTGPYIRSITPCHARIAFLHEFISSVRDVDHNRIQDEFLYQPGPVHPPNSSAERGWEDRAILIVAFTNTFAEDSGGR